MPTIITNLDTIITGPGRYRTRGGKIATVERVRTENSTQGLPAPTFAAIGNISHQNNHGGHTTTRAAWHVSGRSKADRPHSTDIVAKEE